jgi:large subunit ribosomal protein L18
MAVKPITGRNRRHLRIRSRIIGTPDKPRLCVFISNMHLYAQLIDDTEGKTLAATSTMAKDLKGNKPNLKSATELGKRIAELAKQKNINQVVFDRAGYRYHGRVKSLADAARAAGLKF